MVERVVIVQDASTAINVEALRWVLTNLPLKQGDIMRLFRVVQPFMINRRSDHPPLPSCGLCFSMPSSSYHEINNISFSNSLTNLVTSGGGSEEKLNSSATIQKKYETIEREVFERQAESQNNMEIKHITRLALSKQIDFDTSAEAGTLKDFTVQAAKDFGATYVILDSQMKKDQKYVIENLTNCAILIMRRNGRVDSLRDRKPEKDVNLHINIHQTSTYGERMQELVYDDVFCTICGNERLANGFFAQFTYAELTFATYGFSQKYLLSKQRKRVYKGTLRSGLHIVIRKHFFATIKEEDFRSLAHTLSNARHEHVATLLGFCSEGYHRFLVYDFVCNQSLSTHLSARSGDLTWERRLKIALGTSKGLEYLHSRNIYGCVRPRNILLTHDFQPRLANFGLTKNPYEDLNHLSETRVLKTFEYLAPEYDETGTDSSKTDVYSFGVVLLELLTGRKTPEETNGESFLRWARPLLAEKVYMDLVDPAMKEETHLLQLVLIVRLLENCLSYDPNERCSIAEVATYLRDIVAINDH
ncbi:serine/threonine-protein kinase CDG1 [Artemisia annua]|uniref:non-specific serine/threonine protein kinase n=1 Tax=Artemisia annua TaxID=35608 RepID=A0A2U1PSZ5_ARTAN|nr:serine/threonine-protein kinase CDG1 [Artemisia annua]